MSTKISWTSETWNPVTGCTKVSPGCRSCYAEAVANRFWATQYPPIFVPAGGGYRDRPRVFTDVQCHPERLDIPLRWRKPRKIFVCSMSDLFHEDVPDEFIAAVFGVMALCQQHTFQLLTKRPERAREWFRLAESKQEKCVIKGCETELTRSWLNDAARSYGNVDGRLGVLWAGIIWPLPNVWLGTTCENQEQLELRVPPLLETPAAVRFLSLEPLLSEIRFDYSLDHCPLTGWYTKPGNSGAYLDDRGKHEYFVDEPSQHLDGPKIDWVIVGGESGPKARPCKVEWIRSIRDQCEAAGVPCFIKQVGAVPLLPLAQGDSVYDRGQEAMRIDAEWPVGTRFGNPTGIRELNGRVILLKSRAGADPTEWPDDLKVQQFPAQHEEKRDG